MTNIKTLFEILLFAAFAGGLYLLSVSGILDTSAQLTTYEENVVNLERDVLVQVGKVNSVTLDTSLFTRADYKSLKDIGIPLPVPVASRPDPFAGI